MHELLNQFGIDWKLLVAQVVNFFILLFLLQRFAYGPIIKVLKDRRKKIEEGLEASEESKKKLIETGKFEKEILLKAEQQALSIISHAEETAEEHGKAIIESAHTKGEQVIASGQKRLEEERRKTEEEIQQASRELIRASLRKVIGTLEPKERDVLLIDQALQALTTVSRS